MYDVSVDVMTASREAGEASGSILSFPLERPFLFKAKHRSTTLANVLSTADTQGTLHWCWKRKKIQYCLSMQSHHTLLHKDGKEMK